MNKLSNYWRLIKPDGRVDEKGYATFRADEKNAADARSWFYGQFPDLRSVSDTSEDRAIQRRLMDIRSTDMYLSDRWAAEYCLRCFISQQLWAICNTLAVNLQNRGFIAKDLYVLVLEDVASFNQKSASNIAESKDDSSNLHQFLFSKILTTFDPPCGNLSTWTRQLMLQHKPLIHFLREKGYRISSPTPWALLNDIETKTKFKRILCKSGVFIPEQKILSTFGESVSKKSEKIWLIMQDHHAHYRKTLLLSENSQRGVPSFLTDERLNQIIDHLQQDRTFLGDVREEIRQDVESCCAHYLSTLEELHRTWCLLESYRAVYCADLIDPDPQRRVSHAGIPFSPPTEEQLHRIIIHIQGQGLVGYTLQKVKNDLMSLAGKAREYSYKEPPSVRAIDASNTNLSERSCSSEDLYQLIRDPHEDPCEAIAERAEEEFLERFYRALPEALDQAIEQIISQYIPKKQRQRQRFLQAHCLFYCEGKSHNCIAQEFNVSYRTIADDLKSQQRITEISHRVLNLLCERVQELRSAYCDQSQLQQLDREIRRALREIITPEFDQAIAELFTPNNFFNRSLVNVQICYYVKRLRRELEL